jgi:hypothetical protein
MRQDTELDALAARLFQYADSPLSERHRSMQNDLLRARHAVMEPRQCCVRTKLPPHSNGMSPLSCIDTPCRLRAVIDGDERAAAWRPSTSCVPVPTTCSG